MWIVNFSLLPTKRVSSRPFCSHAPTLPVIHSHFHLPILVLHSNAQPNLMDLIEAALAKKRAAVELASGGAKKKYIRKGDLEKQREQEYLAEQKREREAKEVNQP